MRKSIQRFLTLVIMAIFSLNVNAYVVRIDGIYYDLDDAQKVATVTYGNIKYTGAVTIPSSVTYEGMNFDVITYSVTSIRSIAFLGCTDLTSVSIPESVTSIGDNAFSGCKSLASVTLVDGVISIGNKAFSGCGLTSVTIPESVTSIGSSAFSYCTSMTSVTIPENIKSIGDGAFLGCTGLTDPVYHSTIFVYMPTSYEGAYTIPKGIKEICGLAFNGCTGLTSVTIPKSVTSIGAGAFQNGTGLSSITIPENVQSIGNGAFTNCVNLTEVIVQMDTPISISTGTFSNAANATLYVPKGTGELYTNAEGWNEFKEIKEVSQANITFADANVKSLCVANWDTDGDRELSEDEAAVVTDLGMVFKGNEDIESFNELQYFTGLTSISNGAFSGCSNLISVIMPDGIETIGDYAFFSCKGLNSLALPNSVTSIGNYAFEECHSLQTLVIPASVTSIGVSAFGYCDGLTSIKVEEDNLIYDSRDNCNAIIQKEKNILITGCLNTNIPTTVRSIGQCAFRGCSGLTSVNIPSNIIEIGGSAFMGCANLETLMLPATISSIGGSAFWDCNNLVSVVSERVNPIVLNSMSPTFTSSYNRRVLTIPYGTKDAYIAAGWTEDVFKGGIVEAAPDPSQLNTLTIADTEVLKGRQIILPVNMNNTENITAIQFDLTLPAGVSIAKNAQGKYIVEKTGRCADHTLNVSKPGDANVYKVLLYITPVENITGSEGAVLNVTLETSESMAEGEYDVTISNINLTTPDETKITPADVTCKLTVNNSIPGDANGDGSIDVTDIVSIANAILGRPSSSFDAAAADVNGDSSVDVTDIVVVANIILNQQSGVKARNDNPQREMDPREALIPD